MLRIAFISTDNACRSQMAEAFGRILERDQFLFLSAGVEKSEKIDPNAVAVMKEIGVDMELLQSPKGIGELKDIHIAIAMDCNVQLPHMSFRYAETWDIEKPAGQSRKAFLSTRNTIQKKVTRLVRRLTFGDLSQLKHTARPS